MFVMLSQGFQETRFLILWRNGGRLLVFGQVRINLIEMRIVEKFLLYFREAVSDTVS